MKDFIKKLQALSEKQKIAIIIVIVSVCAIIMGYFWITSAAHSLSTIGNSFNSANLPNIDIPNMDNAPNQGTQTQGMDTTDITNWKTYTNGKYGFEIKYPLIFSANLFEKGEGVEFDPIDYKDQPTAFSNIEIYTQGDNLPLQDWAKDPAHKKIALGEYTAWQFNAQATSMDLYHTVIQSKSGELVDIVYRATANGDYQGEYNSMLSTFTFTK